MKTARIGQWILIGLAGSMCAAATPGGATDAGRTVTVQRLGTVLSEPEDNAVHELKLELDASGAIAAFSRTGAGTVTRYAFDQMKDTEVGLAWAGRRRVATLECRPCDAATGGHLRLRYLHNGITGGQRMLELDLVRRDDGSFTLTSAVAAEPVQRLRLTSRRWLGVLIGIDRIAIGY